MAAPRRSTSSTRSTASARRPWTPSAPGSSHRRDMASLVKHGGIAWRFAVLGGATAGLALSPAVPVGSTSIARPMLVLGLAAGAGLVVARPGDRGAAPGAWLALLA